jgi:hypothetical protein
MCHESYLDPPDFITVEEILETCFTREQAQEFSTYTKFIDWYDCACDEDMSPMADSWYQYCVEEVNDLMDEARSNCQDYDIPDKDIVECLLYLGR